jgi:hypothetical protein
MTSRIMGIVVWVAVLALSVEGATLMTVPVTAGQLAASSAASSFPMGEKVVLLDNDPPNGLGLKAGWSGTVLCHDSGDNPGSLLISWDFWSDGKAGTSSCSGGLNALYPAHSALWVDPNVVRLGRHFKQCGVIRKGLEGCVDFEANDGKLYRVNLSEALFAALNAGTASVHFGGRAQVQGLLNTTPPASDEVRSCLQGDGDILHPILSPCPGNQDLPDPFTISLAGNPLQLIPDPNSPGPGYTYDGCTSLTLEMSFQAKLSVQVTPAAGVTGIWTAAVTPDIVGPGTVTVQICVHVEHLDISTLPVGDMQVATISLFAAPVM